MPATRTERGRSEPVASTAPEKGGGLLSTTLLVTGGAIGALGAAALAVGGGGALWAASVVTDVEAGAANRNDAKATGAALSITAGVGAGVAVLGGALLGLSFVEWE